jgi:ankyrin repeat protein
VRRVCVAPAGRAWREHLPTSPKTPFSRARARPAGHGMLSVPLFDACMEGQVVYAEHLLTVAGVDPDGASDVEGVTACVGDTALMIACSTGHAACAQLLIQHGATIDKQNRARATALHLACLKGHANCVAMLLEHGAQIDKEQKDGTTAMHFACHGGHLRCVQILSSYGACRARCPHLGKHRTAMDAEDFAELVGREDIVSWLRSSRSWTVLHHLQLLTPERTKALLRAGADLDLVTGETILRPHRAGEGETPLDLAQEAGSEAAALVLLAAEPWSASTHHLFPLGPRLRASILIRVGFLLCKRWGHELLDPWRNHIMPQALDRSTTYNASGNGKKFLLERPFVIHGSRPTYSYRTYTHGGVGGSGMMEVTKRV